MASIDDRFARTPGVDSAQSLAALDETGDGLGGMAFADSIGLKRDGPGVARLTIKPSLLNGGGLLLGPVGFALIDFSMASALWSHRNPGERIATISISLNFIQSAHDGEVTCESQLDRRNRHTAALTSRVCHEDGRLLMTALGSFAIYTPRAADAASGREPSSHLPSTAR